MTIEELNKLGESIPSCVIIPDETDFLMKYARKATKGMIELGSAEGRSSVYLGTVAHVNDIPLLCIDMWDEYPFETWEKNIMRAVFPMVVHYQRMSTVNASNYLKRGDVFPNTDWDFLFIDADHKYESVKADFENYLPLLSLPATVVFHDVNHGGAKKFFDEIKDNYKHETLDNIGAIEIC